MSTYTSRGHETPVSPNPDSTRRVPTDVDCGVSRFLIPSGPSRRQPQPSASLFTPLLLSATTPENRFTLTISPPTVSPRAHTIPHTTAYTGTCSGAHTCARLPMSTCTTSHTHTAPLSRALGLTHLCAHAHMHMHTARQTASHTQTGYHIKQTNTHTAHTCTHACTQVRTHSWLHTHIHT